MDEFIHSFTKWMNLLSAYDMPCIILSAQDMAVNKATMKLTSKRWKETDRKQNKQVKLST